MLFRNIKINSQKRIRQSQNLQILNLICKKYKK
nr:MAG TPA: hypothetical protein [Caudoviricetes sp.]